MNTVTLLNASNRRISTRCATHPDVIEHLITPGYKVRVSRDVSIKHIMANHWLSEFCEVRELGRSVVIENVM